MVGQGVFRALDNGPIGGLSNIQLDNAKWETCSPYCTGGGGLSIINTRCGQFLHPTYFRTLFFFPDPIFFGFFF